MNIYFLFTLSLLLSLIAPSVSFQMSASTQSIAMPRRSPVPSSYRKFRPPPGFCPQPLCKACPPSSSMLCSVIGESISDDSSDSGSELSYDGKSQRNGFVAQIRRRFAKTSFMEKLLKVSNFASLLCVLDCTILPFVTIILPLFGIIAASPAQMEFLHELGHQFALYFVLPIGGLATTMNYTQHRKLWISAIGWIGLALVVASNAGCHLAHGLPGAVGHWLHHWLEYIAHGVVHRVTNLTGCFLLLFSNYLSHKQGSCSDPACTHKH